MAKQRGAGGASKRKKRRSRAGERISVTVGPRLRKVLHEMAVAAGTDDSKIADALVSEALAHRKHGTPVPAGDLATWEPRAPLSVPDEQAPPGPFGWVLPVIDCCCCRR